MSATTMAIKVSRAITLCQNFPSRAPLLEKVSMAAFSYPICFPLNLCHNHRNRVVHIKINGFFSKSIKRDTVNDIAGAVKASSSAGSLATVHENGYFSGEKIRQKIPTRKQLVDPHRQGLITEGGVNYRQTVVIRSYEVGPDKTATLESLLNLLQETALNHVWMSGLLSNGFGATHGMVRNHLIWVVSRMHVEIHHYPIWGEVVDIDTWVGGSGKNGMRRDWLIRSQATGTVFARGTSTWVMMNEQTRRLSKMPCEVRDEISPWFIKKQAIKEDIPEKIVKLDDTAKYVISDLKPKRSDLDMNHHVNNVKYVRWMLETIPENFLETHQLSTIILDYRRECKSSDRVQSLCQPDEDGDHFVNVVVEQSGLHKNMVLSSGIMGGNGHIGFLDVKTYGYTHLLQTIGETQNEEIVSGRTRWKRKISTMPYSA